MIRHEGVSVDRTALGDTRMIQKVAISRKVTVIKERDAVIVAPLRNVHRNTMSGDAWPTSHKTKWMMRKKEERKPALWLQERVRTE